jgi:hypothetical protein
MKVKACHTHKGILFLAYIHSKLKQASQVNIYRDCEVYHTNLMEWH